jgi:hypothetical protein
MFEKSFLIALVAGILAGIMQISTIFVLGLEMKRRQMIGSLFISFMFGFGVAIWLMVKVHMDWMLAGTLGTLSGAMPAVFVPMIVTKKILKQLGLENKDLSDLNALTRQEVAK